MCVKLPPEDLNLGPYPHTPQAFILVEWLPHQGYAVINVIGKFHGHSSLSNKLINKKKKKKSLNVCLTNYIDIFCLIG